MNETIHYYETNAERFIQSTVGADMGEMQAKFLARVPEGGKILDLGCGAGRDSLAFARAGYDVTPIDGSPQMCAATERLTGLSAICTTFEDFETEDIYDGIWACASLLHLPKADVVKVMNSLRKNLREGGVFYVSFKYGTGAGERNGRYFTDLTEESFAELMKEVPGFETVEEFISGDVRPGRGNEGWLNVYLRKE